MTKETSRFKLNSRTKDLVGCGLCIALGVTIPMVFHLFGVGASFTPMHLPVLLCGLCFGPFYGLACGLVTPIISSLTTGMPPLYPTCLTMTFELSCYGFLSGFLYRKTGLNIYLSLILSMLGGRIIGGIITAVLLGINNEAYGFSTFATTYFLTNIPGILLQLILLPPLVFALTRAKMMTKKPLDRK